MKPAPTPPRQTRKARALRKLGVGPQAKLAPLCTFDNGVQVPVRLISEANVSQREHWAVKHRRVKRVRSAVSAALHCVALVPRLPCCVLITRVAPRELDDDNNVRACKAVRDQIAQWLGVDDSDPRVVWRYGQQRAEPRAYGCVIRWEEMAVKREEQKP